MLFFFFSSRRRHTRSTRDWSSDVCSSDLGRARGSDLAFVVKGSLAADRREHDRACVFHAEDLRSEERRVGKECRSRWSPYASKKEIKRGERVSCALESPVTAACVWMSLDY